VRRPAEASVTLRRREAAPGVYRPAAAELSLCFRRPEAPLSGTQLVSARRALRPESPAIAWRPPVEAAERVRLSAGSARGLASSLGLLEVLPAWASRSAIAWRPQAVAAAAAERVCLSAEKASQLAQVSAQGSSAQPVAWAQWAPLSPPGVSASACVQEAPRSGERAAGYEQAVRPPGEAAHARAVPAVASAAVAAPQRAAAVAVRDVAAAQPQAAAGPAARDAEEVLRLAAPVAWAQQQAAARPLAAPSVFRRGPALPWLAPRRAARFAHGMRR
jgi:hypothetical protein